MKFGCTPGLSAEDLLDEPGPEGSWDLGRATQDDLDNDDPDNHELKNSPAFWGSHLLPDSLIEELVAAGVAEVHVIDEYYDDAWFLEVPDFDGAVIVAEKLGYNVQRSD